LFQNVIPALCNSKVYISLRMMNEIVMDGVYLPGIASGLVRPNSSTDSSRLRRPITRHLYNVILLHSKLLRLCRIFPLDHSALEYSLVQGDCIL